MAAGCLQDKLTEGRMAAAAMQRKCWRFQLCLVLELLVCMGGGGTEYAWDLLCGAG
jgi:hypothetical protein